MKIAERIQAGLCCKRLYADDGTICRDAIYLVDCELKEGHDGPCFSSSENVIPENEQWRAQFRYRR